MRAKDLQFGSKVYRATLDEILAYRVNGIQEYGDGNRTICSPNFCEPVIVRPDDCEFNANGYHFYINLSDAELEQLSIRCQLISDLEEKVKSAMNAYIDAVNKYSFAEKSTSKDY